MKRPRSHPTVEAVKAEGQKQICTALADSCRATRLPAGIILGTSEIIELLHAEAHFSDDGPQGAFGDVSWMAGHRDGDVLFGEVVNRVTAGPDFDAAGPAQFASQITMRDRDQLRH